MSDEFDFKSVIMEGLKRSEEHAIDLSIRTGVPLVVAKNGKIEKIYPKYKYVRVPIKKINTSKEK